MEVGRGGGSLYVILRVNFKNLVWNTQMHGILDMKAWLKLNHSIIFVKRESVKIFTHFENFSIASSQPEI
jgi:hypothetical protein